MNRRDWNATTLEKSLIFFIAAVGMSVWLANPLDVEPLK